MTHMPNLRTLLGKLAPLIGFKGSEHYWEMRYRLGGHSGAGSRGTHAEYKAVVLNNFIARHGIGSVIEFGCGDGYQLAMIQCNEYTGVDVSPTVIRKCKEQFDGSPSKHFLLLEDYDGGKADLSMSLDVIFHLVEDRIYHAYLDRLFAAAEQFVVIYSTSVDMPNTHTPHVRHRDVAADCAMRFPSFRRLVEEEAAIPPPTRFDRGIPTQFMLFQRES